MVNRYGKRFGFKASVAKANFHSFTLVDDDLAIVQMKRTMQLDRPIYIGLLYWIYQKYFFTIFIMDSSKYRRAEIIYCEIIYYEIVYSYRYVFLVSYFFFLQ